MTENIFDSPTGRSLLVPQAPRIIGQYDDTVELGQRLLLVGSRQSRGPLDAACGGPELAVNNEERLVRALRDGAQDTVNHAGQQIIQRQLQVAPTLTIRPGFPVRIIVTRDLVFVSAHVTPCFAGAVKTATLPV